MHVFKIRLVLSLGKNGAHSLQGWRIWRWFKSQVSYGRWLLESQKSL